MYLETVTLVLQSDYKIRENTAFVTAYLLHADKALQAVRFPFVVMTYLYLAMNQHVVTYCYFLFWL